MIIKNLKIFSQNVCKNYFLTELILENNQNVNIILSPSFRPFLAYYLKKVKQSLVFSIILESLHISMLDSLNYNFYLEKTL